MFRNKSFTLILIIFAIIFSSISLVNHYLFRTYALDLGAYTNALYDYSHFQFNDSTVFKETQENLLADHFDLYLILISPLSIIFKTYTLLIVQILMLLIGSIGIFKFFDNKKIAFSASLFFLLFFGVYAALAFDYHSNVIATCLVPWFFLFIKEKKNKFSIFIFILIIIAKENMALWTFFISIGLSINYWNDKAIRKMTFFFAGFSIIYFVVILGFIMPLFSNNNAYPHFHYSVLGSNASEALLHLFKHPIDSFIVLFTNHLNYENADYIKAELHILLLIVGLPLLLKKPQFILMLIPIFFQKLFHDNPSMWGISNQYSIEFAPIMTLGIFTILNEINKVKLQSFLIVLISILNLSVTIRSMDNTINYSDKRRLRLYKPEHYKRNYDVKKVYDALKKIPKNAVVSCQSAYLPHLALRDNIYQFPIIKDAKYVVISLDETFYPYTKEGFNKKINSLLKSKHWKIEIKVDNFYIFKTTKQ